MEDVLKKWALRMDSQGFPPRPGVFEAAAGGLFEQQLDDSNDSKPKTLGPTWLRGFLNRHLLFLYAIYSTLMDFQRAFASHSSHIKDCFRKLKAVISKYQIQEENTRNMNEKGFTLGIANSLRVQGYCACRSAASKDNT